MELDPITRICLSFVGLWAIAVVAHALAQARSASGDPAPPSPPEEHGH